MVIVGHEVILDLGVAVPDGSLIENHGVQGQAVPHVPESVVVDFQFAEQDHFVANNNQGANSGIDDTFEALAGFITSGLDLFPAAGDSVPAAHQPVGTFFDPVDYVGAFEPGGENWLAGKYLDELGMFYPGDVLGCTYSWACNYDASANKDDGSCDILSCGGCTYPDATNFNAAAVRDDGSCTFSNSGPNPCPTDVDGDGTTGVNDLLEILSLFGASCD